MKFSIKETADLVTFTKEILKGKLHYLRNDKSLRVSRVPGVFATFQLCLVKTAIWSEVDVEAIKMEL